jgi:DNA-binding MarR family transcriptional regulator
MNDLKEDFFGKLLAQLHMKIFHLFTKTFQKEGVDLTFEQFILLKIIQDNEGISQQELAVLMNKDKTSIARAINILEDRHKVVRIPFSEDKRKKVLYLTKEGREHLEKVRPTFLRVKESIESGLDSGEIEMLKETFNKIKMRLDLLEQKL